MNSITGEQAQPPAQFIQQPSSATSSSSLVASLGFPLILNFEHFLEKPSENLAQNQFEEPVQNPAQVIGEKSILLAELYEKISKRVMV